MPRARRLADGTLRPAVRRARAKKNRIRRAAWLANFKPGERARFFHGIQADKAVYLAAFQRETGLGRADAAALLDRVATERRWRKLSTLDGTVVGIAPPAAPPSILIGDGG